MSIDLTSKTALITGASRGIGRATAIRLAAAGARVVLCARTDGAITDLARDIGEQALAVTCDVTRPVEVQQAVDQAVKRFGSLDILVNNAGVIDPIARLEDSDPADWGQAVDINLKGAYHCMRAAFAPLARSGGVIINLSSGAATGAVEGWAHYCATKAGVLALTRCAHLEWADLGIRVVGLSPGTVTTDMQSRIRDSGINAVSRKPWSDHIPPEDVAQAIAWLTQDEARVHDGGDFSIKTPEGRRQAGLPPRDAQPG